MMLLVEPPALANVVACCQWLLASGSILISLGETGAQRARLAPAPRVQSHAPLVSDSGPSEGRAASHRP